MKQLTVIFIALIPIIPTSPIEIGILSQYAVGVMPHTIEARQEWGQLPQDLSQYAGAIAVVDCDMIGRSAWLSIDGRPWELVIAADCSGHTSTTNWMRANNVLAEISGELAERHDVVCLCPVPGRIIWAE